VTARLPAPPPAAPARPTWGRRLRRWLLVLLALRLLLALLLTTLLEAALGASGLDARLDGSRLWLHDARLRLEGLSLRLPGATDASVPATGGASLRLLDVDLDLPALLVGSVRVERADVEDAGLALVRAADGRWPLLDALAGPPGAPEPEPEAPEPFDLRAPVAVQRLTIEPLRVTLLDTQNPTAMTALELAVRLTDMLPGSTGRLELRATPVGALNAALDVLRADAAIETSAREACVSLRVDLAGLQPARLQPALDAAGLRAAAGRIDAVVETRITARVSAGAGPSQLEGSLAVAAARVLADGREVLALDHLSVGLQALRRDRLALDLVGVSGLRAALVARADGSLGVAGLDLLPALASAPEPPVASSLGPPPATSFALRDLQVHDARLEWRDERVGAQAALSLILDELTAGPLDDAAPDAPLELRARLRAPGLFETLELTGRALPFAAEPSAELALSAGGLRATALDPWLAPAGWASDLRDGTLTARFSAAFERDPSGLLRGSVALRDLVLADGDERLRLAAVELQELELEPEGGLHVGVGHVAGPVLAVSREADGTLRLPGLRSVPAVASAAPMPDAARAPAGTSAPATLTVGSFTWDGAEFSVQDDAVSPPVALTLAPHMLAEGLRFGGPDGPAGRAALSLAAPGAWGALELQAELRALETPRDLGAALVVALADLHAGALSGWLADAGLAARDLHADLRASLDVQARAGADARTDLAVSDLTWTDGGTTWLSFPRIALAGLRAADGGTRLDRVEVAPAEVRLRRDADGVPALGGLRLTGGAPVAAAASTPAPQGSAPAPFALGQVEIPRVTLHWSDVAVEPAVELPVELTLQAEELAVGVEAAPGRFALAVRAPGVCEPLSLAGTLALPPGGVAARAELAAAGVRLEPLQAYFPAGLEPALQDGRLSAQLALTAGPAPDGGTRLDARLSALDWREADAPGPLLALESLHFAASRLDAPGGVLRVDEVSLSGLVLDVEQRPGGTLSALGLLMHPAPAGTADPAAAPAAPGPPDPRRLGALPIKDFRIERLDLAVGPLRWCDASGPEPGVPLVLNARLAAPAPLVVLDRTADDLAPVRLELRAAAEPLARALEADLFLDASAARPGLALDLRARGLRGAGLTEVLPALAGTLDGSGLSDGVLTARLDAELSWPRRGPLDFDLSGGLSGEVSLSDVALRAVPEGEPLLGLQRLDVGLADVRPRSGAAHLSQVEVSGLLARVGVSPGGLTVGGVRFVPAPAAEAVPSAPPPVPPLRIDSLTASGLDLLLRDETCSPPLLLPLRDLELELRGFSRGVTPAPALRVSAAVRGGEVPLPARERASSLLAGMLGAAAQALAGGSDAPILQPRRVFDEIAVQGRIEPGPAPRGWLNASLSALELPAFAGPAARAGVQIGDGTLDATTRVRLAGADGATLDATLTFGSLSLSEPSDGPISRWLALPAPLDSVLFLLRNEDGEHVIPLGFRAPPDGLGTGRLAAAAAGALGSVIGRAVASSPLRLLGSVTDLVGVTGGEDAAAPEPPLLLDFAPGDPLPPAGAAALLAPLAGRLADDEDLALVVEHAFGGGDAERALALGNPPVDDARALAERLRLRRAEHLRTRDQLAAEARALYAVGRAQEAALASARLLAEDRALGGVEQSLDRVLSLLDAGAERRASQRARAAAMEFGEARQAHVRRLLLEAGGDALLGRVELRPVRYLPGEGSDGGRVTLTVKPRPSSGGLLDWLFGWIPDLFASGTEPQAGG